MAGSFLDAVVDMLDDIIDCLREAIPLSCLHESDILFPRA